VPSEGLRIALFAEDLPPEVGGTHVYNVELARRLAARGHELRVFGWESGLPDAAEVDAREPYPIERAPRLRVPGGLSPDGVAAALERWGSQVAWVSGGCRAVSQVVRDAARRVPVVVSVHDARDKGAVRGRLGRMFARRTYGYPWVARLAANSSDTRQRLVRLGVPPERVEVVHPGVDCRRFAPDAEAGARLRREHGFEDREIVLTVSRLAPNKGHARVIDALAKLRDAHPQILYAIVGDGEQRERLERRVAERGVADLVHFAGCVADAKPWYAACDVFAMASIPTGGGLKAGEGFGIAYAEAGACGKPAVASSSGGAPEVVVHGETGLVVDPDDDAGLVAALHGLLAQPERARRMGERARDFVSRFDWDRAAVALERLLGEAAREGAR
jgi:phosphatidylinositol alpha-1,6-mannosyltransferase